MFKIALSVCSTIYFNFSVFISYLNVLTLEIKVTHKAGMQKMYAIKPSPVDDFEMFSATSLSYVTKT